MLKTFSDLPLFLTAPDIAKIMRIGRSKAYELMQSEGFPSLRIGKCVRVSRDAFISWLNNEASP